MRTLITLEQRVKKINSIEDLDTQLRRAKSHMMRLKKLAKNQSLTLNEKIELQRLSKSSEAVLRELRHSYFDIEDHLRAGDVGSNFFKKPLIQH
jgi:hypothetical protein